MTTQVLESPGKPGRPKIGPKAQTAIHPHIFEHARRQARSRGVPLSDIWREMLEEAYALRTGGEA